MEGKVEDKKSPPIEELSKIIHHSTSKIKQSASQMVLLRHGSGQEVLSMQELGSELSGNYDDLSQASLEIVKTIDDLETSKDIRNIVLLLGRTCLDLIKGATETSEEREEKETNYYKELITEIDDRIKSLHLVLNTLDEVQNSNSTYRNAMNVIHKITESLQKESNTEALQKDKQELDHEQKTHIQDVKSEAYGLFHSLKMVLCSLTSSEEEQDEVVQLTLASTRRMMEAVVLANRFFTSVQKEKIVISAEAFLDSMKEFFEVLDEVGDSLQRFMNKNLVKNAIKDIKNCLQLLLNHLDL